MSLQSSIEIKGCYRIDNDRNVIPNVYPRRLNESRLQEGRLSKVIDLSLGTEGFVNESQFSKYQDVFEYLKKTREEGASLKETIDADFFSNRRNLVTLSMAKFEHPIPHYALQKTLHAVKKCGVIFLYEPDRETERTNAPFGYKFEQYMTLDQNNQPHSIDEPLTNAESTRLVLKTSLGDADNKLKVFYTGEVDAIDSKGKCVEFKTTCLDDYKWAKRKSLAEYLQAYFGGCSYIVRGHKKSIPNSYPNESHLVDKITVKRVREVPENEGRIHWYGYDSFGVLYSILNEIKDRLANDGDALRIEIDSDNRFGRKVQYYKLHEKNCTFLDPSYK